MERKAEDGKPVFSECELLVVRFEWGGAAGVAWGMDIFATHCLTRGSEMRSW